MNKRIFDLPNAPLPLDPDSYYEVLIPDGSSASGYTSCKIKPGDFIGRTKVFKALLHQSGTSDPSAYVLQDTVTGIKILSRATTGIYVITCVGAFPAHKTIALAGNQGYDTGTGDPPPALYRTSDDTIEIAATGDDYLNGCPILIEIYP